MSSLTALKPTNIGRKVIPEMSSSLARILLAQGDAGGGAAAPASFIESLGITPLIVGIGVLFYFMVLRPETKRRSDQDRMHKELKKNDRIVTIGGIHGTVVNAHQESDEVTIKVDEASNTKLRITRTAVQTVLNSKSGGATEG